MFVPAFYFANYQHNKVPSLHGCNALQFPPKESRTTGILSSENSELGGCEQFVATHLPVVFLGCAWQGQPQPILQFQAREVKTLCLVPRLRFAALVVAAQEAVNIWFNPQLDPVQSNKPRTLLKRYQVLP
jgi:hypothetical protein